MKKPKNKPYSKTILRPLFALLIITVSISFFCSKRYRLLNTERQSLITPDEALNDLVSGNKRFYSSNKKNRPSLLALSQKAYKQGQFPKAVILACMDSRSVPEIIFDQSIGDIFTLRIAGNVINDEILASFEYATKHAGAKLIVVMGHTQCGAIEAVCKGGLKGSLKSLAHAIDPAKKMIRKEADNGPLDCSNTEIITDIAMQNVRNMKSRVIQESTVIQKLISKGKIKIVSALHDLKTGIVTFE